MQVGEEGEEGGDSVGGGREREGVGKRGEVNEG